MENNSKSPSKTSRLPGLLVATGIGLATLIGAESLRRTQEVCPTILDKCRTADGDKTQYPIRPEVRECIADEVAKETASTKVLVTTCGQYPF